MNAQTNTRRKASGGRILWEIINPGLIFLVCSLMAGFVVGLLYGLLQYWRGDFALDSFLDDVTQPTMLAGFLLAILVQALLLHYDKKRFGKTKHQWGIVKSLLGIVAVCVVAVAGNLALYYSHLEELFPAYSELAEVAFSNQNPIMLLLTTVVFGPIAEEMTFRGLTQRRACLYLPPAVGIFLSALLFGLYHMNMIQFLYATPLGLLLGWLYYKSGNLWVPILAHMAANATSLLLPI